MLDLSIIIISWKMKDMLKKLLLSIEQYTTDIIYEIIVIDNNSQDGTSEMIKGEFSKVHLITNTSNLGVARARNQGLKIASGRYLLILDADMVLKENSFMHLMRFMDQKQDAGLTGCKLVFPDNTIQPSSRRFPTLLAFLFRRLEFIPWIRNSRTLRWHEMADWDRSDIRSIDYVIGACQMIRREAFQDVGFLDENIFYGPEDIDFCSRMHKQGWKIYYYPFTSIVHYEQRVTKKKLFSKLTWLHFRGIVYLFIKHRGKFYNN